MTLSSKVKNISLSIFLNFLSWSEELYAVQCEATGRRDHGRIEPRWFSIRHTESIRLWNRLFPALGYTNSHADWMSERTSSPREYSMTEIVFSHCGGFLRKCFQEQIGQIPARYGQLKGYGLYKSINNKYKYKYVVLECHELWSRNGLKLDLHFYPLSVHYAFFFIAGLRTRTSDHITQPNFTT